LLQVKEAVKCFSIEKKQVVFFILVHNNDLHWWNDTYDFAFKENVKVIKNWVFADLFFHRYKFKIFINELNKLNKQNYKYILFNSQYLSDPSMLICSIINPVRYYLMDEGTASFNVVQFRGGRKFYKTSFKIFIKSILYGYKISSPTSITYFTQYNLEIANKRDEIFVYKFNLREIEELEIDENWIIFLGSSMTDVNMLSLKEYLNILRKVKKIYFSENLCYYAHRKESAEKLNLIKDIGFNVVENDKPFEMLYKDMKKFPKIICSFQSPVLDNLSKNYLLSSTLIIFRYNIELLKRNKTSVELIYKEFEKNKKLTIVDI